MERGFIQGKMEIKFLLLFILARSEEPLGLDELADVAMCDDGVGYFDLSAALAELVDSGHALLEDGSYTITDKGRKNGAITEDELPYSVRLRCEQRLSEINEARRRQRQARAALEQQENGLWRVSLALDSEEGNRFTLELTLPLQEDAQRLIRRFQTDPQRFYHALESL